MSLLELLARYTPHDHHEAAMVAQLQSFLESLDDVQAAFGRELAGASPHRGHVTGSAWMIDESGRRVVLAHHAKLSLWVQPGGHCDGDTDVRAVALREAYEETGIGVVSVQPDIFDVDVHAIPEYWNTPEHLHYDVRFLLQADGRAVPVTSPESRAVRWMSLDEAATLNPSPSITRMIAKTKQKSESHKMEQAVRVGKR